VTAPATSGSWRFASFAEADRALDSFLDPACADRLFVFQPPSGDDTVGCLCWHGYDTVAGSLKASAKYVLLKLAFAQPCSGFKAWALRLCGARIHKSAYLAPQLFVDPLFPSLLVVEKQAVLGLGVRIALHDHMGNRFRAGRVIIREQATIGADARIACGIEIGRGARVALGAVVLRDVPPGAFVVGNPARVVPDARF
jgi:serine acetyltransferase